MKTFSLLIAISFLSCMCDAQTIKASIKDLSFMKGQWFTQHEWGDMEEYWSEPSGNCLMSSYRCVKDGKVIFYEFVVIEQTDSVPVMLLRHFNAGCIGWEDKEHPQQYPLISITKNKAVFKSNNDSIKLIYELISDNQLDVVLEENDKDGKLVTTPFHYTRKG